MIDNARLLLVATDQGDYDRLVHPLSQIDELKSGRAIDRADTVEQARLALQAKQYDLCLLTLPLGEQDGLELLRWAEVERNAVPFLVVTDEIDPEMASRILESGAEGHLYWQEITPSLLARSLHYALRRHRSKRRLLEDEARFRTLVENSTDAVVQLTSGGDVLYASPSAFQLVGRPVGPPQGLFDTLHPDDRADLQPLLLSLPSREPQTITTQFRLRHQDGRWLWMEGTLTHPRRRSHADALAFTYRDITERKQVEERLDRVLTNAHCILWGAEVIERCVDGVRWFEWSRLAIEGDAAQRVLPLALEEGQSYAEAWFLARHPDDVGPMDDRCHRAFLLNEPYYVQEFRCKNRYGEWRWLQEHVSIELLGERQWRNVGVCMDITPLKRLEGTLKERTDALELADQQKDIFLAMLAHELRNPLAPILNGVQIARMRGDSDPAMERLGDMIERQVQHMARLLDDLFDISRITQGKIVLRHEVLDLAHVVSHAVQSSRPSLDARNHEFTAHLEAGPILVRGDAARLEQVIVNLLTNAAKYTEPGGRITLTAGHEGEEAFLRVEDTGIGISPELLPRVFDLFAQADASLDRSKGGLGIGLTLVKYLVERHGGRVTARSPGLGQGSVFEVHLPGLTDRRKDKREPSDDAPTLESSPQRARLKILVVDDNEDAAETLAEVLTLSGCEAAVALDGPSALAKVEKERPDAILLDLGLPGMDGYEVARKLGEREGLKKIHLIALTGFGQEEARKKTEKAGFDAHLVKPVDHERLLRTLTGLSRTEDGEKTETQPEA